MPPRSLLPRVRLHKPGPDALTIVCVGLVVSQLLVAAFGGVEHLLGLGLYELLGLSRQGIQNGMIWQVVTHPFLHGSWVHLLLNAIVIYMIGGGVLHILGGRAFVKVFFGGVLAGSALHLLLHPAVPSEFAVRDAPLVGASAGAMALLLTLTGLSPDSRMWPLPVSGKNLGRGLLLATLILYLLTPGLALPGLSAVGGWIERQEAMPSLFQIGHIYHFGGGLVGLVYSRRLLRRPVTLEELRRARERRERREREGMVA